jgi:hypothetical protein
MAIKVLRLAPSTGEWRVWGGSKVEVHGTQAGLVIQFTRRIGRGTTTFCIEFDEEGLEELMDAMPTRKQERPASWKGEP